jgi:Zn-dependent protease
MLPIPPLDGSRMLATLLPYNAARKYEELAQYSNYIFLGLMALSFAGIHILGSILSPVQGLAANLVQFFIGLFS